MSLAHLFRISQEHTRDCHFYYRNFLFVLRFACYNGNFLSVKNRIIVVARTIVSTPIAITKPNQLLFVMCTSERKFDSIRWIVWRGRLIFWAMEQVEEVIAAAERGENRMVLVLDTECRCSWQRTVKCQSNPLLYGAHRCIWIIRLLASQL